MYSRFDRGLVSFSRFVLWDLRVNLMGYDSEKLFPKKNIEIPSGYITKFALKVLDFVVLFLCSMGSLKY